MSAQNENTTPEISQSAPTEGPRVGAASGLTLKEWAAAVGQEIVESLNSTVMEKAEKRKAALTRQSQSQQN
jgi:hypothetical protein